MSYAAGMALGLSVGQKILEVFSDGVSAANAPAFGRVNSGAPVRLLHSLPGRRRYSVGILKENAGLASMLETYLVKIGHVKKVSVNPLTASFLIEYDCSEETADALIRELTGRVFCGTGRVKEKTNGELAHLGRQIYDFFIYWDGYLREKTGNKLDLRSFVAFSFIITGLRKLLLQKQFPAAPQLLWWAFSLLRRWGSR